MPAQGRGSNFIVFLQPILRHSSARAEEMLDIKKDKNANID